MKVLSWVIAIIVLGGLAQSCSKSKDSSSDSYSQDYRAAVKEGDYEAAHEILADLYEVYSQIEPDYSNKGEKVLSQNEYYQAFDYIYKAETQYIIAEVGGMDAVDKIIFLMEDIPVDGTKPQKGLCNWEASEQLEARFPVTEAWSLNGYIVWTRHYNDLCNKILSLAINRKNQELAQSILLQFVDNVEVTQGSNTTEVKVDGIKVDVNHGYIKYTSTDRDAAQEKYDKAVESGAFD